MRMVRGLIAIGIAIGMVWLFPLFHVIPLKTAAAQKAVATFNPAAFAEIFWTNQLLPSLGRAVNVQTLLPAIQADATAAKTNYSRSAGMGETYFYYLSGRGRVVGVSDDEISLATNENSTNADVALQTGLVFGNALRDGTGLLNINEYPNSQDFNGISEALNHIVEMRVLPKLREQARPGATISFTGCAEVDDESTDLKPLKVIPIETENKFRALNP
jgi:predicted lipoprotein